MEERVYEAMEKETQKACRCTHIALSRCMSDDGEFKA